MLQKFRNFLYKFMYGRNGVDSLGRALFIPMVFCILLSMFIPNNVVRFILSIIVWLIIFYMYFRMFSKNISKRRAENAWYEGKVRYLKTRIKQRKDYRFYTCPKCKTHLRVPKGAGKIIITCKNCGEKFERKA